MRMKRFAKKKGTHLYHAGGDGGLEGIGVSLWVEEWMRGGWGVGLCEGRDGDDDEAKDEARAAAPFSSSSPPEFVASVVAFDTTLNADDDGEEEEE
jgi:hypothetical protein